LPDVGDGQKPRKDDDNVPGEVNSSFFREDAVPVFGWSAPVPASRPALRRPERAEAVKRAVSGTAGMRQHGEEPPFDG
jgi:hypothetical protein